MQGPAAATVTAAGEDGQDGHGGQAAEAALDALGPREVAEEADGGDMPGDIRDLPESEQQSAIKWRAVRMLLLGTITIMLFSDPMVDVLNEHRGSSVLHILLALPVGRKSGRGGHGRADGVEENCKDHERGAHDAARRLHHEQHLRARNLHVPLLGQVSGMGLLRRNISSPAGPAAGRRLDLQEIRRKTLKSVTGRTPLR